MSSEFPRYFIKPNGFKSDALYVRHDTADDAVVITPHGERSLAGDGPWPLSNTVLMVEMDKACEISEREARALEVSKR